MTVSAPAMSPTVSTCIPGERVEAAAAGSRPRSAVREPACVAGLGVAVGLMAPGGPELLTGAARALAVPFRFAAGLMTGNSPAALPAGMSVTMARFTAEVPSIGAAGGMAVSRLAALPAPMSVLVEGFTADRVEPGRDAPAEPAEPADEEPADGVRVGLVLEEGDRFELGVGLVLEEGDRLGLVDADAECVGLALAVGDADAECVRLALAVGDADAECVGLALAVGDADAECVGLALAVGDGVADTDVDGDVDGDADVEGEADVDCDDAPVAVGCGELGAGVTMFANAGPGMPKDSPQTSRPPATRRAASARGHV
jgi:hypothetical protein